ncbi:hypothetical protein MKW94_026161 [Papaver nudicaule]|uniref:Uncharacterized protein n=1 Tax=Papaver nudicaule TaxID=74823 RepID=A0AA41SL23_PAPNU|nr:hypothetical protein [Papaver nudicaule]
MSLVDYASSSDDEDGDTRVKQHDDDKQVEGEHGKSPPSIVQDVPHHNQISVSSLHQPTKSSSQPLARPIEKLPDASLLLDSPAFSSYHMGGNDHSSRVAAAMAESSSRKRESKGSASTNPRSKFPRGNLPNTRSVPDTVGGVLVPPQLKGRSNVVTEDIGKLFVKTKKTC